MRLLIRITFMILAIAGAAWAAEKTASRQQYAEKYGLLSERNIFLRDRSRPATTRSSSSRTPARPIEESFVLRGVVIEEDGYRAYLEDTRSSSIVRVESGDAIARGKVSTIEIDAVEYEQNGTKTWIEVGQDLTGKASTLVATSSSDSDNSSETPAPTTGASPSSAAKVNVNDPNLSIEQRLKLRRQQELQPK